MTGASGRTEADPLVTGRPPREGRAARRASRLHERVCHRPRRELALVLSPFLTPGFGPWPFSPRGPSVLGSHTWAGEVSLGSVSPGGGPVASGSQLHFREGHGEFEALPVVPAHSLGRSCREKIKADSLDAPTPALLGRRFPEINQPSSFPVTFITLSCKGLRLTPELALSIQ